MSASRRPVSAGRLSHYRPVLDRTLFVLALLGVLLVIHLWMQQERGFDQGCFGFNTEYEQARQATFDCEAVTQSDAGSFLGLSNVVWGLAFYLTVALLGAGVALLPARTALLKKIRGVVIVLGFLYAIWLVNVQFNVLGDLCALCLISAGITTLLFLTLALDFFQPNPSVA